MSISKHTARMYMWFKQPRKFKITLQISIQDRYFFKDFDVIAKNKNDAINEAKYLVLNEIEIKPIRVNSLGRVKSFEEIKIK